MRKKLTIVATCTFGLETVLKREIIALGYEIEKVQDGKIFFIGSFNDVMKANMYLRSANRVLLFVTEFMAESFDELYDKTKDFSWEEIFNKNASFNVSRIASSKSKLFSKTDCQRIIKKAIIDRLKNHYKVATLLEKGSYYPLIVNIRKDNVQIFINTSGEGLHKRGYRKDALEAPIKETLAAGIVLLSNYQNGMPFADIMCGSGTIIIEAALISKNQAPGLNRSFAFEGWEEFNKKELLTLKDEATSKIVKSELRLLGSDIDYRTLKIANENALRANVSEDVAFQKLDAKEFRNRKKNGIIVTNPPYGERIGSEKELKILYKNLGEVYSNLTDWRFFAICAHPMFENYFGKKATKNRKLFNGNMLTYLYQYYPERKEK